MFQSMAVPATIRGELFHRLAEFPHLKIVRCLGKHNEKIIRELLAEFSMPPTLVTKIVFEQTPLDEFLCVYALSGRAMILTIGCA